MIATKWKATKPAATTFKLKLIIQNGMTKMKSFAGGMSAHCDYVILAAAFLYIYTQTFFGYQSH